MLLHRDLVALLREAYFNGVVELEKQEFSNFLVRVFQFQERALHLLVDRFLEQKPLLPRTFDETNAFWANFPGDRPELYQFLQGYRFKDYPLRLEGFLNRPGLLAILEYGRSPSLDALQVLNGYCEQRNQYIHQFEGISELEGADVILRAMRQVLSDLGQTDFNNPFNQLNDEIGQLLNPL